MVQHILHYNDTSLISSNIIKLSTDHLITLAKDKSGSHILTSMLSSSTVSRKYKKKLLKLLKVQYVAICVDRYCC